MEQSRDFSEFKNGSHTAMKQKTMRLSISLSRKLKKLLTDFLFLYCIKCCKCPRFSRLLKHSTSVRFLR